MCFQYMFSVLTIPEKAGLSSQDTLLRYEGDLVYVTSKPHLPGYSLPQHGYILPRPILFVKYFPFNFPVSYYYKWLMFCPVVSRFACLYWLGIKVLIITGTNLKSTFDDPGKISSVLQNF